MTDEQIIKALECCKSGTTDDCKCCPRLDGDRDLSTEDCMEKLMHDALTLINRQKETIEQLKTALFKCGEDAVEIANYKKIAEYQQGISMDRGFEIKRLKEEIERLQKYYDSMEESIDSFRKDQAEVKFFKDRIRADAVKGFAEMLKKEVDGWYYDFANIDDTMDTLTDIDKLVKEFTEGADGHQSL